MDKLKLDELRNAVSQLPEFSKALIGLGIDMDKLDIADVKIVTEALLVLNAADNLGRMLNINIIGNEIEFIRQFDHVYINRSYFYENIGKNGMMKTNIFLFLASTHAKDAELILTLKGNTFISLQYLDMLPIMAKEFISYWGSDKKNQEPKNTYIMLDSNTDYYKIGRSKDPYFREETLLSIKPTISLIGYCEQDIERELHDVYELKRIRGEWFSLTAEDVESIITKYNFIKK